MPPIATAQTPVDQSKAKLMDKMRTRKQMSNVTNSMVGGGGLNVKKTVILNSHDGGMAAGGSGLLSNGESFIVKNESLESVNREGPLVLPMIMKSKNE